MYLEPKVGSEYECSAFGQSPRLYIGEVDPRSPAALSIRIGECRREQQEFWGFLGYPQTHDEVADPAYPESEEASLP